MNALGRALLGALFGALLTLFIHPASRPFLLATARRVPFAQLDRCIDANDVPPAPPHDLQSASMWIQLANQRMVSRPDLRPREYETMIEIADRAALLDRENAFWLQEKAVFLAASGHAAEARQVWDLAARQRYWNDYQSNRLLAARDRLIRQTGSTQAWQLAYVYHQRSVAPALIIERYARQILLQTRFDQPEDVHLRYVTLANGNLMRLGSRSVTTGSHAANIVELAAYPPDLVRTPSPKRLLTAQNQFLSRMTKLGMVDEAANARKAFSLNESWRPLIEYHEPEKFIQEQTAWAIVSGTLIGAAGCTALVGLGFYVIGLVATRFFAERRQVGVAAAAGIAIALAVVAVQFTHDLWAGLVSALAGAFLLVTPNHPRKVRPEDLGPLFTFVILVMASLMVASVGAYVIAHSPTGATLLPELTVPVEYYASSLLLGLAAIFLTLVVVAAPIWALVQRLETPHVLGLALRKLGVYMAVGSLVAGIVMGPLAVYFDRQVSETLMQLVENEPVYFFHFHDV